MPQENRAPAAMLAAIAKTAALADLSGQTPAHGLPEAELQALLEGHAYAGHTLAPHLRLLTYEPGEEIVREGEWGGDCFYFVVEGAADVFVKRGYAKVGELQPGALFGEMSVLANLPRSSTVCAPPEAPVSVLEVQRQALPLLRKLPQFAAVLDKTYRRNSRALFLQDLGVATRLDAEALNKLSTISQYRVYEPGHVLFQEGESIRRLFVLKTGWLKLSKASEAQRHEGDATDWAVLAHEDYLGAGHCLGLEGVASELPWPQTATLLTRAEVLEISVTLLRETEALSEDLNTALKKLAPDAAQAYQRQPLPIAAAQNSLIRSGVAATSNLLAIDARTCIRCGNCAAACQDLHGQSRLSLKGFSLTRPLTLTPPAAWPPPLRPRLQPLLVPSVCQHCRQPDCLTGCPVNAIQVLPDGRVDINAQTCIGCGDCAALCPFDAITLVARAGPDAATTNGEAAALPVAQVAVKCDLCVGAACNADVSKPHVHGCEENCPTGALRRVVPDEEFAELHHIKGARLARLYRKREGKTLQLLERWHAQPVVNAIHLAGSAGILFLFLLAFAPPLLGWEYGGTRAWAWFSALPGTLGLCATGLYAARKRARTARWGPLRYWLLAHSYVGLGTLLLFVWHGALAGQTAQPTPLTKGLALALSLTCLTGVLGQLLNVLVPRWLTKHEAQPWLLADLLARRTALLAAADADAGQLRQLNRLIAGQRLLRAWVWPHVLSAVLLLALLLLHLWQVVYFSWR
ncbi:MAG: cyclic nucleotide-binding domain-containing protein [Acidobacteria bacterium]|nr:cyclic nucleotide-binding domain-containing protein [Acidobacteriota bacterium]MBI3422448.1 cyclic nucleotide-binding domain-containing protein [Acidobacteriota bacterium]